MLIEFLGTGTSHGIPVIGCPCPVCRSKNPADTRYRASLRLEARDGSSLVIDTGPEFRLQALRAGLEGLDAVLLTHAHADHLHGLDDLRPLSRRGPIPVYGNRTTIEEVESRFAYIFTACQEGGGKPRIRLKTVSERFSLGALDIEPIPLKHGSLDILGWRISEGGRVLVYASDVKTVPDTSVPLMSGADILVLGALQERPHSTHLSFGEALELIDCLSPGACFITHLCHEHSHRDIVARLAPRALPARDGLRLAL